MRSMRSAPQPPPKTNEHHTLPRSNGGSDGTANIARLDLKRHAAYHERFASNHSPLSVTRLLALHSIGYGNFTMHPDRMDDLFEETTTRRWQRLYEDDALADNTVYGRRHLADVADAFVMEHAREERALIQRILRGMDNGAPLPWRTDAFLREALDFFQARSPIEAIRRLHTEESGNGLAWAKCLREDVRRDILSLLNERKLPFDRGCKHDLRTVLSLQRDRLTHCIDRWKKPMPHAA